MPDLVDSDEGFNNDPASRATDCFAKKTPFLDGALERSFQMLLVRQERVAQ
jgi:hypothetical protein